MDAPELATVVAVQDLFARYAHRIDRRDFDGFAALFADDALLAFGDDERRGRENIRQRMTELMTSPGGMHAIVNVSVRPDGADRATAIADYVLTRRQDADGPWAVVGAGYYDDVFVRERGEWKFGEHRIIPR
jgi:uncharacterized protein (TIGR02246 family)